MRRAFVSAFLPLVLFALEPVNLIKVGGFEKNSELWLERSKIHGSGDYDSTVYNRHDPDSAYIGNYCGSIDGRTRPAEYLPFNYGIEGYFYQIISYPKLLKDLDSLELFHMVLFRDEGVRGSAWYYAVELHFTRPSDGALIEVVYTWAALDLTPTPDNATFKHFPDTLDHEGVWYSLWRDLRADLIEKKGLSEDTELDTFALYEASWLDRGTWRGQKAFFDGVRLTGYADYNIALTRLSGNLAYPAAIVWNNGREDQTDVRIIAYISGGMEPYSDTVTLSSLASDDSTEVKFKEFSPISGSGTYHLIIVTGSLADMDLDECDEDDLLTKYYPSGVSEDRPEPLTLEVRSLTHPLRVSYSLPYSESGTLTLYDASGRRVERMAVKSSGKVVFESALPSGVYIVRLKSGQSSIARKAVVLG